MQQSLHLRRGITDAEVSAKAGSILEVMDVRSDCVASEIDRAARTAVALDKLVELHGLTSLAYYHKGVGTEEHEDTMSSVIVGTSLLTASGVPVAGEFELKNVIAMKIMDALGAGGSFTEYYGLDFKDDIVLMGHDGPAHIAIGEGKTKVKPLDVYHGKAGRGLSVEMSVKHGPVTLLSVVEGPNSRMQLLTAEAESVPGPILEIGNTNSRYRFKQGAKRFVETWNSHGPAHHCAVGTGHLVDVIGKIASLLKVDHIHCA